MMTRTLHLVTTKDDEKIAVWKVVDTAASATTTEGLANTVSDVTAQNVFLTHGTFSDKKTCLKIAEYFAGLGHHCYIMEWRGHGDSSQPKESFNFETVATYDYEATFISIRSTASVCLPAKLLGRRKTRSVTRKSSPPNSSPG